MSSMTTIPSTSSSLILDDELNRLLTLCSYISQTASRIRLMHLSRLSFSPDHIKLYRRQLLSMAGRIEGSTILLESLLATEQRQSITIEPKKTRICYTRQELLKLREYVTLDLSNEIKTSLNLVVERESNHSMKLGNTIRRHIQTILL